MENGYTKILPHLFAACALINSQINKLDTTEDTLLCSDLIELDSVKSTLKELQKTANYLQLSVAKCQLQESARLISIFYGLLFMIRPSITRLVATYVNPHIRGNTPEFQATDAVIMH